MKILLVQPRKADAAVGGDESALFEPLALSYLASALPSRHEVKILDMRLDPAFDELLQEYQPDLVGITAYTVHVNVANRLFQRVKQVSPDIFTVVGGHHATVSYRDFLTPDIDMIVVGEGSFPFREIVERLDRGSRDFDGIAGTVFQKKDGELVVNETVQYDLDTIPFPDRSLTGQYRQHYASDWLRPIASLRTSKGCPFRCSFCALWAITGKRYLARDPRQIVEELKQVEEPHVFLADDESFIQADRMMELARQIKEAGIQKQYYSYIRADTAVRHPELLAQWRDVGLTRVFVGYEFIRDEDLKAFNKGSTAVHNVDSVKIIQDLGIDLFPAFIVRPDFDKQDFQDLTALCKSQNFDFVGFGVLTPLPGTQLFKEVADQMILRNYDYYDFIHSLLPLKLPPRDFYKEYLALVDNTWSLSTKLAFLRKYPLREVPDVIKKAVRFYDRVKQIHKSYDHLDEINAAQPQWAGASPFGQ